MAKQKTAFRRFLVAYSTASKARSSAIFAVISESLAEATASNSAIFASIATLSIIKTLKLIYAQSTFLAN